jgi:hypothetical protein
MSKNNPPRSLTDDEFLNGLYEFGPTIWNRLRSIRNFNHPVDCPTKADQIIDFIRTHQGEVGRCVPECVDLFTGALVRGITAVVDRPHLNNPGGYVNRTAGNYGSEWLSALNYEWKGVSKPKRKDGVPQRVRDALPKEVLPELLSWMLQDACRRSPVPAEIWSYQSFATELVKLRPQFDFQQALDIVQLHVQTVLRVAREVAGDSWTVKVFEVPQAHRRLMFQAVPVDMSADGEKESGMACLANLEERAGEPDLARAALARSVFQASLLQLGPIAAMAQVSRLLEPEATRPTLQPARAVAVRLVVEMITDEIGIDPQTHRLRRVPDEPEIRRIVEASAGGARGSSRRMSAAFLRLVSRQLVEMGRPMLP